MRTVTVPLQVLQLLEPRVLGSFVIDFVQALPYEASQRAHVMLADLVTGRGPMLPPGTTVLEQLLGLAAVESSPSAAELAEELARPAKRPASRAVAQSTPERAVHPEVWDEALAPKAPRKRTSSAEVEELIRTAYGAGLRGVGLIAQSTGLGRTTVAAAVKRMQLEGVAT